MIQCRLRELMATRSRQSRRRIIYKDVAVGTGLSRTTLHKLANDRAGRIATTTLDKLCWYFACQPGDLLVYVPDGDGRHEGQAS